MPENNRLYPLKFNHIFKEKIWGGRRLEKFLNLSLPGSHPIGESWELCDRENDVSIISNGYYKNCSLKEVIDELSVDLIGTDKKLDNLHRFPVLIKLLDISNLLSVQVHPDNETAIKFKESDPGKTEMWYVLHAEPDTKIVYGCKNELRNLKNYFSKEHEKLLDFVPVKTGDVVFIPAGQVHALLGGTIILEIQQNSDVTYRLYDWNRTGLNGKHRELHLYKGLRSIKNRDLSKSFTNIFEINSDCMTQIVSCGSFRVLYRNIKSDLLCRANKKSYRIICVIDGTGTLLYGKDKASKISLNLADIVLLPAALGDYNIIPDNNLKVFFVS
ncbi:class I mannose-6-phosphate isomerase [bacterium]|nr:class I mannose-6-phosphate isomerase [bacterium]